MARQKIIAGNWKMNGTHDETEKLIRGILENYQAIENLTTIVCPPFTSLSLAVWLLENSGIKVGAQDLSEKESGAFTGDISAEMLTDIGVKYVIIGHSERRQFHFENNETVNAKLKRALGSRLVPIVCVGESLEERENGQTERVVSAQFEAAVKGLNKSELENVIVAYEPIWAIGTGRTASPEMAQEVHLLIRNMLGEKEPNLKDRISILYGGSVNPENAAGLFAQPDIDGGLVGGASLEADSFLTILDAAK